MLHFSLAVLLTVSLYLMMRAFPRYKVDTFQAIVFNYYSCVVTGLLLMPSFDQFKVISWGLPTLLTLLLGIVFIAVFLLMGLTTVKVNVTVASLAGNMSLVIPVLFGLLVFRNNNKDFTWLNYLGLILALVALALSTIKKDNNSTTKLGSAWVLPLVLFVASGLSNTLINYLNMTYYTADQSSLFTIIACSGSIVAGTSLLVYRIFSGQATFHFRHVVAGLLLGIPNFLSFYFLLAALADFGNSAAFVFPIYNILCMLVSALAAWILFKEKLEPVNKIGLVVAILAIILISYQELGLQ
jgi:drug/metabolite transporter (DMT)-like permease